MLTEQPYDQAGPADARPLDRHDVNLYVTVRPEPTAIFGLVFVHDGNGPPPSQCALKTIFWMFSQVAVTRPETGSYVVPRHPVAAEAGPATAIDPKTTAALTTVAARIRRRDLFFMCFPSNDPSIEPP